MEVLDILEEVLYLVYVTQFQEPGDQFKPKRKARQPQEPYPQGLAYVCCPLLFLLLRQEQSEDDVKSPNGAFLSESQKIISRPANTQEEKIIKRKLIDFYLEKIEVDLFNLVCSMYQKRESGTAKRCESSDSVGLFGLHQNPLEYVFSLNDLLDEACPEVTRYLAAMEMELSSTCFSWMAHVLLPHWEKLQYALQAWDRYIVVLRNVCPPVR